MPSQFLLELSWKIVHFRNENYDTIIKENFLVTFEIKINLDQNYLEKFGKKLFFDDITYPLAFDMITSLLYIKNEYMRRNMYPLKTY